MGMTDDDRERLRRIAYGPDATTEERVAAETELRQLDHADVASRADTIQDATVEGHPPPGIGGNAGATSADDDDDDETEHHDHETEPSLWGRSIRVAWLIPIVVGSLVIGYLASLGGFDAMVGAQTTSGTGSPTPSANPSGEQDVNLHLGDLDAADSWFDRPYSESDAFPDASALESYGISAGDVRIAAGTSDKVGAWVARAEGLLCLIMANTVEGSSASSCTDRDRFAKTGIRLFSSGSGSATWFGREVTTDPLLEAAEGAPHAPGSGPGDVAAANAWFDSAVPSSDQPPAPRFLKDMMGVDPAAVSYSRLESAPWVEVWLAKQGSVGFCIASTDDQGETNFGDCATNDEFQLRGLALTAFGFSMFWDGTSLSSVDVSAAGN